MNKLTIITLCLLSLTLMECKTSSKSTATKTALPSATTVTPVEPTPAAKPDPAVAIAIGESIYGAKCAECHKLPQPSQYTQADWAHIMIKMSRKAHLTDTETAQVLAFVNNSAKQ